MVRLLIILRDGMSFLVVVVFLSKVLAVTVFSSWQTVRNPDKGL